MSYSIVSSANTLSMFCRMQMKKRKDIPIRLSEMGVLIFVHTQNLDVTPVEISRYFNIRKPSVTAMVKRLLEDGYLVKKPSENDGRSYLLRCANKGETLVTETFDDFHAFITELKEGMGNESFNDLIELLDQANQVLSTKTQS